MDNWIERFKNAKPINENQKVIIPGEPELAAEKYRTINGIPLIDAVVNDLNEIAVKMRIEKLGV
jgi:LDH2 family malate/lactate/ureidoglycolate dehydrogenase